MLYTELTKRISRLGEDSDEQGLRIRRYTMDPRIKKIPTPGRPPPNSELREELEKVWKKWFALKGDFRDLPDNTTVPAIIALEKECDEVERGIDLVQRVLVSASSFTAGLLTVVWLSALLLGLGVLYFATHAASGLDF